MAEQLTPKQFEADLRRQTAFMDKPNRRRFMRKAIGHTMQSQVIVRFARGGYESPGDWKSASAETKYDGRWSKDYDTRPSGDEVTAGKIRNVDTRQFANSYRVISADHEHATVGPGVSGKGGKAPLIAEREENIDNHIVGFSSETIRALDTEMQNYLDHMARTGESPPYLPKSHLGRRTTTNLSGGLS